MNNRPRGRQKNVTGQGKDVKRRGSGLGTGPVGMSGRKVSGTGASSGSSARPGTRTTRSGGGLSKIVTILLVVLLGGGGGSFLLGGNDDVSNDTGNYQQSEVSGTGTISSMLGNLGGGSVSTGWDNGSNAGELDTTVVSGARDKYTEILGGGKDEMTLMIYLCGTV